jgi:hypothetical protein
MPRPKPKPFYTSPEDRERRLLDADSSLGALSGHGGADTWEFVAKLTLDLDNKDAWVAIRRWRLKHGLHGAVEDWVWVARAYLRRQQRLKAQAARKLPKPTQQRQEVRALKKFLNRHRPQPRAVWPPGVGDL